MRITTVITWELPDGITEDQARDDIMDELIKPFSTNASVADITFNL